jgi:hypothetical protein
MPGLEANVASLDARLDAPRLAVLPWLGGEASAERVAVRLDVALLRRE